MFILEKSTTAVPTDSDQVPSNRSINNSAGPRQAINPPANYENADDGGNILNMNEMEMQNNEADAPRTILLVGETGVGKSSLLEFIATVFLGNDIGHCEFDILDPTNERGSGYQSQTTSVHLYKFTSKAGMAIRILDTPGFANAHGTQQDELHNKSIVAQIKTYIDSVTAIVVVANGTIPRGTGSLHYVLSTLPDILPKNLANKIAFVFTNVANPLSWNFCPDTLPKDFKRAPQFRIDNPIALQKKYLKLKDDPKMTDINMLEMRKEVKVGEQEALEMLENLFDWLDDRGRLPTTTEMLSLSDKFMGAKAKVSTLLPKWTKRNPREQRALALPGVVDSPCLHLILASYTHRGRM